MEPLLTQEEAAAVVERLRDMPYPNNPRKYEALRSAIRKMEEYVEAQPQEAT